MKMKFITPFMVMVFFYTSLISNAQVKTKIFQDSIPSKLLKTKVANIPEILISAPTELLELLSHPKVENQTEYSNQFAVPKKVDLDFLSNATIIDGKDFTTFVMTIKGEKALNISFQFSDFVLPQDAILSIYSRNELTDSITAKENNKDKVWATRVYQGNKVTIALTLPTNERNLAFLKIDKINFGFKKFGGQFFGTPGASAACNINVLCPEGNGWENERNTVALIVANGSVACTGSLIMNTCGSNIPYFLTANHCLSAGNVQNWVFQFQYWSATCTPNTGWREDIQFNGCTLRANFAPSDFALLELSQLPQPASGIFYSGWDRNTITPNESVCIHHPAGDLMKFSHDFNPSTISSWGGTDNHWVSVFNQGTVQPGSSGSPLYNINHRVVGQLHGNQLTLGDYCAERRGEYGRFDISWTGGGTNATRLSNWLDRYNTGFTTTNTTNVSALTAPPFMDVDSLSINGPTLICNTSDYRITNLPLGASVTWSIPSSAGQVLQLAPNIPSPNQLRITNQKWYGILTTLTGQVGNLGCGTNTFSVTKTIENDNSTSASVPYQYYQEACTFYNVSHPSQSGTITSNSSPVFVYQGCMVYVNLGDMTGRTVSLAPGSGQPLVWGTGTTSYYQNTLYFQLPLGSGGVPFTFTINGDGACYQRSLLFFSYSNNGGPASVKPIQITSTVTPEEQPKNNTTSYSISPNPVKSVLTVHHKISSPNVDKKPNLESITFNVYELATGKLVLSRDASSSNSITNINVAHFGSGYYVLKVIDNKKTESIKFIKE